MPPRSNKQATRILVVAAHPDDEVLGCGGVMAKANAEGDEVRVIILATGKSSRHALQPLLSSRGGLDEKVQAEIAELYEESRSALAQLGVAREHIYFADFPDQQLATVPQLDVITFIKPIVQDYKPEVVYTHHAGDYNQDHLVTFEATLFCCRPYLGEHYPSELYSFEVLSSTEWASPSRLPFTPNVYVNIDAFIDKKRAAMRAYDGELKPYPHPRSEQGVKNLAMKRGNEISAEYAECFQLIRKIHK